MLIRPMLLLASATALLAACDSAETPEEEVAERPPVEFTPAPTATAAPDGTALASGTWDVNEDARGARAVFGEAETGGETGTELMIACDAATREVTLVRMDPATGPASYAIEAGGEIARLDMVPVEEGSGAMMAEIDPTLAVFANFSAPGQIFSFTNEDGMKVQYPTHPGISRVLYACM